MTDEHPRILWFEDSAPERDLIEELSTRADPRCRIEFVADGREAPGRFDAYTRQTGIPLPALVVLDIDMPGLNGIEILAILRERRALRELPVAFFTSSDRATHVAAAHALGAIGYFIKKDDPAVYEAAVDEIVVLARDLRLNSPNPSAKVPNQP